LRSQRRVEVSQQHLKELMKISGRDICSIMSDHPQSQHALKGVSISCIRAVVPMARTEKQLVARPANERYARYRAIIDFVTGKAGFLLDDVKQGCPDERPAFVTRVVRELEQDGLIVQEQSSTADADRVHRYRWNSARPQATIGRWLDDKLFGTRISESPEQDRPRERMLRDGVSSLTTSDLLAILIRSGRPGESAVTAGQKVARVFERRLQDLPNAARGELKSISIAVEKTAFCQIMAGIELGRRVHAAADVVELTKITSTATAIAFCRHCFRRLVTDGRQEEFHIVTLDTKHQVIATHQITVGTLDASLVHPREVFRPAIKDAAAAVILVHNHPSGDPTPSREDRAVTQRLESAGEVIGIDVLDHIVLGRDEAVSIREAR
jgi:DNA repair protein RadC